MKTSHITILYFIVFSACTYRPYPKEKYEIGDSYRNLIRMYSVGDILIFKSSQNLVDSFVISGIDSAINDKNGYFINARNSKTISITYKQIPFDKWQEHWIEMGPNNEEMKERSGDATFISIVKFPDSETTECYFNFMQFRCSKKGIPELNTDTVKINGQTYTNYYKIENCVVNTENTNSIQVFYSTIDKGLVAFKTNSNIFWTRQN
jgi:hypothetical protein